MPVDIAVIPVAGRGTGLLPLTKSQPKEMLPVGRKPVVQYVVEELARCGLRKLLFITGPGKAAIENHFDINAELIAYLRETGKEDLLAELAFERDDVEYFYTRQRQPLGLGHAVLCARPMVEDRPFVVALGDSIIGPTDRCDIVSRMVEQFERQGADAVVAFGEVSTDELSKFGIAKPRGEAGEVFVLDDLVEKPSPAEAPSHLAVTARYVCGPKVLDHLENTPPDAAGEIQLTDALRSLIAEGGKVLGVRLKADERRYHIGDFESFFQAFTSCALADPERGERFREYLRELIDSTDG